MQPAKVQMLSIYIPENGNIGFIPRILGKNIFIEKIFHYSKFNGKIQEGDLILAVNRSIVGVQIDCQQAVKQINQAEYRLDLTVATEPDAKIPASKAAEHMKVCCCFLVYFFSIFIFLGWTSRFPLG